MEYSDYVHELELKNKEIDELKYKLFQYKDYTKKLLEEISKDHLTRAYSRVGMQQKIIEIGAHNYLIANLDLDNFKVVNDNLGHEVGDEVLFRVVQIFNNNIRNDKKISENQKDFVVRYGGDEFYIFFLEATEENMPVILDRMKQIQEDIYNLGIYTYKEFNKEVPPEKNLSVSIGLGYYNSAEDIKRYNKGRNIINSLDEEKSIFADLTRTSKASDDALYNGKKNGKNKIMFFSGEHYEEYTKEKYVKTRQTGK